MSAIASRVEEARRRWNAGDLPGYLTLYDDAVKLHGVAAEPLNKTEVTELYQQFWRSFGSPPPLEFRQPMTDGDLFCCRFTMTGKHVAPFMGVPATNRSIELPGITMMRFSAGRVIERWSSADLFALMVQIGGVSPPSS
jgi:predicted ester cyclase